MTGIRNLLVAALLAVAYTALNADDIAWETDYDAALAKAKAQRKPVLMNFTAPWCKYCKTMDETVMADPVIQRKLKGYVTLKIDFDTNPELVAKYRIRGIPAYATTRITSSARRPGVAQALLQEVVAHVSGESSVRAFLTASAFTRR